MKKLFKFSELIMLLAGLALLIFSPHLLRLIDPSVHVWGIEPVQNVFLAMFYLTMSTAISRILTRVSMKYFTDREEDPNMPLYAKRSADVNSPKDIDDKFDDPWEQKVSLQLYSLYFSASIVILVFTL